MAETPRLDGPVVGEASSSVRLTVVAYVVLLALAEVAALELSVSASLVCYGVLTFALLTHLGLSASHPALQPALIGIALVSILQLGAIVLPQQLISETYWEALPCALALATIAALRRAGAGLPQVGTVLRSPPALLTSALVAVATGPVLALVLSLVGAGARPLAPRVPSFGVLLVAGVSGFTLELIFRGYLQVSLIRMFGPAGIVITSFLYGGLFIASGSVFLVLAGLVTGLVWGALAVTTQTVWGVAFAHVLFAMAWALLH
jgi:hypothetical protein